MYGRWLLALSLGWLLTSAIGRGAEGADVVKAAQAFRAHGEPVVAAPDGNLYCEGEEFKVEQPGWQAGAWGENYYAATFANTFLSRKAFLGAPAEGPDTVATINVTIKDAGRYLVLVRYEAAYRFETQFKVKVEQGGRVALDRLYGARDNLKVWAFSEKLKKEVGWFWGAVENIVWEGHDAYADLQPGPAKITLIAGKQPAPPARRNVDVLMLTRDEAQIKDRIEKEAYLPLDGMLTQAGDVWLRVTNPGAAKVSVKGFSWREHSPYWVHIRNWKPGAVEVEPGKTSDWVDVGGSMDTLNDGLATMNASGPCQVEIGVRNAAGQVEAVRKLDANGSVDLVGYADMRYSRRVVTSQEGAQELVAYLRQIPMHGRVPTQTVIYGWTNIKELPALYGLANRESGDPATPRGYVDWRGQQPGQLEGNCLKLTEAQRRAIAVVSLGDEIGLPAPDANAAKEGFVAFLKAQGVTPKDVDPAAGEDWGKLVYNPDPKLKTTTPSLYYWSQRYAHHYGIQAIKQLTDTLRKYLPNAGIGANFSPHAGGHAYAYLGHVFQWANCFREEGLTMPWAEDYIWQLPVGTPQMNGINLDLFRAGLRGKPDHRIHYYVMPHVPGNTPRMWRRLFHNAVGHGAQVLNLFEFNPVWLAYTENHVTGQEMYGMVLRTLREYGLYEDIIQTGQRRAGVAGLWFSETGDIWGDNEGPFAAAKRGLYAAILHQQLPLDFVLEQDTTETLNGYQVLYLTDRHVSLVASQRIAEWVKRGGRLLATAGAGMYDECNRPNRVMQELLGVEVTGLTVPPEAQVAYIKQDLPFAPVLGTVTLTEDKQAFSVFGAIAQMKTAPGATVAGSFADQAPAVVGHGVGQGAVTTCAFLPSLSYFRPAIPLRPVDRGSTDDAMAHFLPTQFDAAVSRIIGLPGDKLIRPVVTSVALVEAAVIESKVGTAILLTNWTGKPVAGLRVTVSFPTPAKAELASGGKVAVEKAGAATVYTLDLDVADTLILR